MKMEFEWFTVKHTGDAKGVRVSCDVPRSEWVEVTPGQARRMALMLNVLADVAENVPAQGYFQLSRRVRNLEQAAEGKGDTSG